MKLRTVLANFAIAMVLTLVEPVHAQQNNPFVGPASNFCVHLVRASEMVIAPLQRAGFKAEIKKNGQFFGRAENAVSTVDIHTRGRNARRNCAVSITPQDFGGDATGEAMLALLDWASKSGHKISALQKGQMVLTAGSDTILVGLEAGRIMGRSTATFRFRKKR